MTATLPLNKTGAVLSSLWLPSALTVDSGIVRVFSDTSGLSHLALDGAESRTALRLKDSNVVVRELTSNIAGDLLWENAAVAISDDVVTAFDAVTLVLAEKEDNLSYYSETTGSQSVIVQTSEDSPTFPLYLSWTSGTYSNVSNSHQLVTTGAWHTLSNIGSGTVLLQVQLRAGTVDHVVFSTNDTISWTGAEEVKFTGLTSSWQTFQWSFTRRRLLLIFTLEWSYQAEQPPKRQETCK